MRQLIAFPSPITRIAKGLVEGSLKPHKIVIGGEGFGLDLRKESCALCGGLFARVGFAAIFYTEHADAWFIHEGCLREADCWTEE